MVKEETRVVVSVDATDMRDVLASVEAFTARIEARMVALEDRAARLEARVMAIESTLTECIRVGDVEEATRGAVGR